MVKGQQCGLALRVENVLSRLDLVGYSFRGIPQFSMTGRNGNRLICFCHQGGMPAGDG